MAEQSPKDHAKCADYLRARAKRLRTDVTVSTCRPLVAGPYTTEPFEYRVEGPLPPAARQDGGDRG